MCGVDGGGDAGARHFERGSGGGVWSACWGPAWGGDRGHGWLLGWERGEEREDDRAGFGEAFKQCKVEGRQTTKLCDALTDTRQGCWEIWHLLAHTVETLYL